MSEETATMRIITLEEHFATPGFLDGPGQDLKNAALKFEGRATRLIEQLTDIADKRIAAMDAAGIDMQVLSLTSPGTEQLDAPTPSRCPAKSTIFSPPA